MYRKFYTLRKYFKDQEDIFKDDKGVVIKFDTYEEAFAQMVSRYMCYDEFWGIYKTTITEYAGGANEMTRPVWE